MARRNRVPRSWRWVAPLAASAALAASCTSESVAPPGAGGSSGGGGGLPAGGTSSGSRPIGPEQGGTGGEISGGRAGEAAGAGEAGASGEENAGGKGGAGSGGAAGTLSGKGGVGGEGGVPEPCGATKSCIGTFSRRAAACPLPPRDVVMAGAGGAPMHPPDCPDPDVDCTVRSRQCLSDVDCAETSKSYCIFDRSYEPDPRSYDVSHYCMAACGSDADCEDGTLCLCGSFTREHTRESTTLGRCQNSLCRTDDDCEAGYSCISPSGYYFACQTPADECWGPEDCPAGPQDFCNWTPSCRFVRDHYRCELVSDDDDCYL